MKKSLRVELLGSFSGQNIIFWNSGWFLVFLAGFLALPSWHLCLTTLESDRPSYATMSHLENHDGFYIFQRNKCISVRIPNLPVGITHTHILLSVLFHEYLNFKNAV